MEAQDDLEAGLREYRVGHLATADAAGVPHIVPVCFVCDGGAIYSAIDPKPKRLPGSRLKRIRNIVENPQVAFLVHHYEEDWRRLAYLLVRGTASILATGDAHRRALALLEAKYVQYRQWRLMDTPGLVIKIVPTSVRAWRGQGEAEA